MLAAPHIDCDVLLKRPESNACGIYILYNQASLHAYIGEGERLGERLKAHLPETYWQDVIFFTSKDDSLTKAHVCFLEGRLISEARAAGAYKNLQNDQSSGAKLRESDHGEMEDYLFWLRELLPLLGCNLLCAKPNNDGAQAKPAVSVEPEDFWGEISSVMTATCARVCKRGDALKVFLHSKALLLTLKGANPTRYRRMTLRGLRAKLQGCKEWIPGKYRQRFRRGPTMACWCLEITEGHPLYAAVNQLPEEAWFS